MATGWALSDGSIVYPDPSIRTNYTPDPQIIVEQAFKSYYYVNADADGVEIRIDLLTS